jgi:ComF family protein
MGLLDVIFPKFCINCKKLGSYLCSDCFILVSFTDSGFCTVCQKAAIGGLTHPGCKSNLTIDGVFSSLIYKGVAKRLVYRFKYKPYLANLQKLLIDFFYEGLIEKELFYKLLQKETSVFVPIPLHASRLRKRGYNQSQLLAKGLGEKFGISVVDCLTRVKNTKTQVGLSQIERRENIKDAFEINKEYLGKLKDFKQVFLVDDVVTSGATLKEAAKILKKIGITKVWGMTLAHGN